MVDRDVIVGFIEAHKPLIIRTIVSCLVLLVVLLCISIYSSLSSERKATRAKDELHKQAIVPDELWYLPEPLPVPGVQLSREPKKSWSVDEMKMWYSTPDEGQLEKLRSAGRMQVDGLLESIP